MAPAAQPLLRRSGTRQGMGRHWPSRRDGCRAVHHAPSLSGSIIKILDLQPREREREREESEREGGVVNNQTENTATAQRHLHRSVVHLKALVNTGSQELAAAGGPSATHLLYPLPVGTHIKNRIRSDTHKCTNNLSFSRKHNSLCFNVTTITQHRHGTKVRFAGVSDPLPPKWVITVAICKGHGPLSASNDASLRESAAKTAGDVGAVPYPSTGRTEHRCRAKKKATTTAQRCTQSKATPTEPCYATARSQASAAFDALRLQRTASTGTVDAFLLAHLSCQQRKHSFALAPSAKRHPSPLMIQCINTFSHQRGADVLRYRILGRDWERCFKKH
ncbi:hypothetical protein QQF64_005686 [Cirrhinus molitorella]|uniref:Uncharacterized protein n=1 Tax=Cirrhinus molitorella TaxID=172907 RepID=A0ABR3MGB7_9TELE